MYFSLTEKELRQRLALPLDVKIKMSFRRLEEFIEYYGVDSVYVSFSGGLDSTVLLHLARQVEPSIKAVYLDTWMEDPRIREFVRSYDNVDRIKPDMSLKDIIADYGWCFPSKEVAHAIYGARRGEEWAIKKMHGLDSEGKPSAFRQRFKKFLPIIDWEDIEISPYCCLKQKEEPIARYEKETGRHPFLGLRAEESALRKTGYLRTGCTTFDVNRVTDMDTGEQIEVKNDRPACRPLGFWTQQDIYEYCVRYVPRISAPYGKIYAVGQLVGQRNIFGDAPCGKLGCTGDKRTGCIFCPVGCHLDNFAKFKNVKNYNRNLYDYCMEELGEKVLLERVQRQYGGNLHD